MGKDDNNIEVVELKVPQLDLEDINPSTKNYRDPDQGGSKIVVIGKPGCFQLNTEVILGDGSIKKIQDISEGESVLTPSGRPANVLELCSGIEMMYDIFTMFGDKISVNKNHILSLYDDNNRLHTIKVSDYLEMPENYRKTLQWGYSNIAEYENPVSMRSNDAFDLGYGVIMKFRPVNYDKYNLDARIYILRGMLYGLTGVRYNVRRFIGFRWRNRCERELNLHIQDKKCRKFFFYIARSLGYIVLDKGHFFTILMAEGNVIYRNIIRKSFINKCDFIIKPLGVRKYYGFTLPPPHLFLLENLSVVHNTGKSTLIQSILFSKKHILPVGIVFNGTEDTNSYYKKFIPDTFIYNEYREDVIENLIERQKIARQHLENPWALLLLDDCTDSPSIFKKELQQGLFKRGRHWKMLYILSLQYCMDVNPAIRTNVDGVFILRETNLKNRRSLYENYAGIIPTFGMFCEIMDQITTDYTALFIKNTGVSNDYRDCIFWYKAKIPPDGWKFGSREYQDFHSTRCINK